MTAAKKLGRPRTRSRPAFLFAAWRAVREEVLRSGDARVRPACKRIIDRVGCIRLIDADGKKLGPDIEDFETLHQWYRQAERARATDAELATICGVWEETAAQRWPHLVAWRTVGAFMKEQERSGRLLQYGIAEDLARTEEMAAEARNLSVPPMPAPKKNRRR